MKALDCPLTDPSENLHYHIFIRTSDISAYSRSVMDAKDQTRHHQDEQLSEKRVVAGNINDDHNRLPHVAAGPDSLVLTEIDLPQSAKTEIEHDKPPNSAQIDLVVSDLLPTGWRLGIVIFPLCIGTLLVAIDNTIIGVAVPQISTVFKALDEVGWYGSAYLLTETALQPIFGNVYKYFNIKAVYLISIVIFECKTLTHHVIVKYVDMKPMKWDPFCAPQHRSRRFSSSVELLRD